MTTITDTSKSSYLFSLTIRLADSALIASQRMSQWCGIAPTLEEDIALTNVALDLLGQARHLFSYAVDLDGCRKDEDQLAFLRDPHQYLNYTIAELPNGDFAQSCTKSFLFSTFSQCLWVSLLDGEDSTLRDIAAKSLKETDYHIEHFSRWFVRLGDGTDVSRQKILKSIDYLWPYTAEFFGNDRTLSNLEGLLHINTGKLQADWVNAIEDVFTEAGIDLPSDSDFMSTGKYGVHSEHLGHILAEMQYLQRSYPGGRW